MEKERVMHVLLEQKAMTLNDRPYLYYGKDVYSFKDTNEKANKVASGLQKLGIKKGDKIAVIMDNCPEVIFLVFGLSKLGAIEVPINTAHKGKILSYMLDQSDSKMVVIHRQYLDNLKRVLPSLPKLKYIVIVEDSNEENARSLAEISATVDTAIESTQLQIVPWSSISFNDGNYEKENVVWSDPLLILYTSGTTGLSKGVVIPHNYLYFTVEHNGPNVFKMTENDRVYTSLPLFHMQAWHSGINQALYMGASVVLTKRFSASRFWNDIKQYNCTFALIIGAITSILYKAERTPDDANNPLQVMVGAPTPTTIFEDFKKRFGVKLIEFYGSTEVGTVASNSITEYKVGSAGKVQPNFELKLLDNNGKEVGINEVGEIVVRPKNPYTTMLHYYNLPDKTKEAWIDGWYHSGDLGRLDEEGYLYFVDRKKDALRRRGENISSFEVERTINSHPAVQESCVIAAHSELGEDEVMACIVLKPGKTLTPEQLTEYCEKEMAYFMIPRYIRFLDSLPKNASLKIEKYKLREEGITQDTWDREKAGYELKR